MTNYNSYSWSDYEYDIVHAALPWIAFAILAFVILIIAIVIRFLRCMCCKQQIKEKGRCIKLTCVVIAFIITLLSLLACSFIIYYSDQTFQSIQQVQCVGGKFPYVLKHGDQEKGWGGMDQIHESTSNITTALTSNYNQSTTQLWAGTNWLKDETFLKPIQDYFENYQDETVTSPYPYAKHVTLTNYTENVGPLNETSTWTGMILAEYSKKVAPIVYEMLKIKNITQYINLHLKDTISFSQDVDEKVEGYYNGTNEVHDNIEHWIINYMPQIIESWRGFTFWVVVWGWFICIGVLITVYSQAMSKYYLAHGLCCFWLFTGMVAVIGFLASAGTLAVGLVTRDSCGLIDHLFTNDGIDKYDIIIPKELAPLTKECIIGEGNMIPVLNLTTFLSAFQNISQSYSILSSSSISPSLGLFNSIQLNIKQLLPPINYSSVHASSVFQVDQANYNLNELNKFTNNLTTNNWQYSCTEEFSDLWVFYKDQCGTYTYIEPGDGKIGGKFCLVVNEWPLGQVQKRYQDLDCSESTSLGDYTESIFLSVDGLKDFVDSVDKLFGKMLQDMENINKTLEGLVGNLVLQYQKIGVYLQSSDQILYLMESTVGKKGLSNSLQCKIISNYKSEIEKSMCDNSLENAYQVFVFVFLLSFLMLLMELVNLYLSRALLKGIEIY